MQHIFDGTQTNNVLRYIRIASESCSKGISRELGATNCYGATIGIPKSGEELCNGRFPEPEYPTSALDTTIDVQIDILDNLFVVIVREIYVIESDVIA